MKPELESPADHVKRTLRFELAPSTMISIVLIIAGLWLLFKLLPILLVLIASFFMVGTLNPAVHWLEKKGISRSLSIAIVFSSLVIVTVGVAILTIPALLARGVLA